jgi:hypothetical protein
MADPFGLFGLGGGVGGSFTFFGYRGTLDFEIRVVKDIKQIFYKGWSGGISVTYSWNNMWAKVDCPEDQPYAWGIEADFGTKVLANSADKIDQLMGKSVSLVGATLGWGKRGAATEFSVMTEDDFHIPVGPPGSPTWELSVGAYPLPGLVYGAEVHGKTRNVTIPLVLLGQE